jgi:hypothetical protein
MSTSIPGFVERAGNVWGGRGLVWTVVLAIGIAVAGCASFQPQPQAAAEYMARAQTQSANGLTVSVAVLTAEESRQVFGVPLADEGMQPVWLRIENRSADDYLFVPAGLDPDYYSPQEAAWLARSGIAQSERGRMQAHFDKQAIRQFVPRGGVSTGYLLTPLDEGVKYVSVQLFRLGGSQQFDFVVNITDFAADFRRVDFQSVLPPGGDRDVTAEQLRKVLEGLQCCVVGPDGVTPGDPLNIVVIGPGDQVFHPFVRRGWDATEAISSDSVWRTISSSLFRERYRNSPVSPLYFDDRPQDIALQKARATVDERNHMRLWITPYRVSGNRVWIGQISRDIGVRLSAKTLVTHKIDPDVDEARDYLLQDLLLSGSLASFGYAGGVGMAGPDEPRRNYTGDPYFTDGLRLVVFVSDRYVPADRLEMLQWESPVAAGESAAPSGSIPPP